MAIDDLQKLTAYDPTEYVDNSEPDIDAEHLNKTEQALKDAIDKANEVIDTLKALIATTIENSTSTVPASSLLYELNSDIQSRLIMFDDGSTGIQSKNGNTLRRLQIQSFNDDIAYYKSTDGGVTWPDIKTIITNADLQSGLASVTSVANGSKGFSVTFPRAFSSLPDVVVTASTSRPDLRSASVASRTTTGFTGAVLNNENSTGTVNVFWIAVAR